MNKQITSILLIAGTCIGAGMFALPLTFAKIGIIPTIVVIVSTWLFIYYSSLVNLELNLHCKNDSHVKSLSEEFSGKKARIFETINLKLISYSALTAYIYGCSSILEKLIGSDVSLSIIATGLTAFTVILFLFDTHIISKINNIAFIISIALFFTIILRILTCIDFSNIPLTGNISFHAISTTLSVVFLSLSYQIIFYAIRDYCNNDINMIKKAYLWGSIVPMIVYTLWTCGALSIIYNKNIGFYNSIDNNTDVGDFIEELSKHLQFAKLQVLVYVISIFTIFTSIIGVGLSLKKNISNILNIENKKKCNIMSTLITILPPYIVSIIIPNAFIMLLKFASVFLMNISIFLPAYLYFKANIKQPYIKILNKQLLIFCVFIGIVILSSPFFFIL